MLCIGNNFQNTLLPGLTLFFQGIAKVGFQSFFVTLYFLFFSFASCCSHRCGAHYFRQRFFNVIQLATSPFIPGQGPGAVRADGDDTPYKAASRCLILNGTIGLSSHGGSSRAAARARPGGRIGSGAGRPARLRSRAAPRMGLIGDLIAAKDMLCRGAACREWLGGVTPRTLMPPP